MKRIKLKILAVLLFVFLVWVQTYHYGPLDYFPRIHQVVISSDGVWEVEIGRRRTNIFSWWVGSEEFVRITDHKSRKVTDKKLVSFTWWWVKPREFEVKFEPKMIILNDFWVIDNTNYEMRMCPLLDCLKEKD